MISCWRGGPGRLTRVTTLGLWTQTTPRWTPSPLASTSRTECFRARRPASSGCLATSSLGRKAAAATGPFQKGVIGQGGPSPGGGGPEMNSGGWWSRSGGHSVLLMDWDRLAL
jgi:hypothetical protein